MLMQEGGNSKMIKKQQHHVQKHHFHIKDHEQCTVHLHEYPSTPGVTIMTSKSNMKEGDLFQLPLEDYTTLMMEVRDMAHVLQQKLKVQRCAMVSEPLTFPAQLKIVPLHGLGQVWKPLTSAEEEYNDEYPGYVSSKNGPRLSNEELDQIQKMIISSSSKGAVSNVFHGEALDDNLFARIVRNEEEHWRVWEDDEHVAFLTPYPNTRGFTVLVPRKHLSSDIFALESEDYKKLVAAAFKVASLLKRSLEAQHCAMIFEGYEIDYAHVKLIPIINSGTSKEYCTIAPKTEYSETYCGFVTSVDGPGADVSELSSLHSLLTSEPGV